MNDIPKYAIRRKRSSSTLIDFVWLGGVALICSTIKRKHTEFIVSINKRYLCTIDQVQQRISEFRIVLSKKRFQATDYLWRTRKRFLTTVLYIRVQSDSCRPRRQWNKKRQVLINVQRFYFPAISHVAPRGCGRRPLQPVQNWGKQNKLQLKDGKTFPFPSP